MKAEEINELMTANLISQAMEVIYILSICFHFIGARQRNLPNANEA